MNDANRRKSKTVRRIFDAFRAQIDETVPLQLATTFMVVAETEGKGVSELAEIVGANKSTMSRHLLDLSDTLRTGQPGYGLLTRTSDPGNLRTVLYMLSPKGKLFHQQLMDILD